MIHQDANLFAAVMDKGTKLEHPFSETRYGWLQVARGVLDLNGERIEQGDGVVVVGESALSLDARDASEVLLFDLS